MEFGEEEVRVEAGRNLLCAEGADVRGILFDGDPDGAGVIFGEPKRDKSGGDDDEEKDRQDHEFADPDDPPVIEEVKF